VLFDIGFRIQRIEESEFGGSGLGPVLIRGGVSWIQHLFLSLGIVFVPIFFGRFHG
jgi:hypothetical protein